MSVISLGIFVPKISRCPRVFRIGHVVVLAACLASLAVAGAARATTFPITDLFSTGVDASGNLISNGASDSHWSVVGSPTVGTANFYNGSAKAYRIDQWIANQTTPINSQWVSVPNGDEALAPFSPSGQYVSAAVAEFAQPNYTYQTSFTLPEGFDSAQLGGKWVCDNVGLDMLLNGISKPLGSIDGGFQLFSITDGFVAGTNTLSFIVRNDRQNAENFNPTGLQVQVSGTYAVPEPGSIVLAVTGAGYAGLTWLRRRRCGPAA